MSNPLFRCLLLFSALSVENNKEVYLSVLCVSAVNYCNIFKSIVPLTPEATMQVTPQDERVQRILEFCQPPRTREEIQAFIKIKDREYFRKNLLQPLLKQGLLKPTIPDKPTSSKQKYYATKEKK